MTSFKYSKKCSKRKIARCWFIWRFLRLSERSPGFALNWQPPASTRHAEGKTRRMFRLSQ